MPLDIMNANFIGGQGGHFEPQRANQATLQIVGLDNDDLITMSVTSWSMPKVSSGIVELAYLNEKRKFTGNPTYEDLSIVVNDYVDQNTASVLWAWRQQVHDPVSGLSGLAADYKKTGYISLFDPSGQIERQWRLEGLWPQNMDPGEIDYTSEDTMKIHMTIVTDKFYALFAGISP